MLVQIIKNRSKISDHALIVTLKALSWAAKNDPVVCMHILDYDGAINELLDYLRYPHRGIKV